MSAVDGGAEALLSSVAGSEINDPEPNTNSGSDRCNHLHAVACSRYSFATFFFFHPLTVLSLKAFLADQQTAPADINCALARCLGAGEQLLGDLVADVTENSCVETSIPWQLLTQLQSVAFFMLRLSLHP